MEAQGEQGEESASLPHLRVAWVLSGDLRPYRVPFVNRIAHRQNLELTVFHGTPRTRFGAPERLPIESIAHVELLQDLMWPMAGQRTAWLKGTWRILRGGYDVIVCQETVHNLTTWVIALTQRVFGFRFVLHGHFYGNTNQSESPWRIRASARRMLAKRAKSFLAYTDRGRDALVDSGVSKDRVFVTRNTLDTEKLMEIADEVTAGDLELIRGRLGVGNGPILLMLGRLLPEKRVDILIDAVDRIAATHQGITLLVIGDGIDRERLEAQARDIQQIRFLGAIYDENELAPYLVLSDLLVIPGRIGLTCVHGFTAALPSVTASAEIVHQSPEYDYIQDGVNGIIVPELSSGAFAQAIIDVLGDADRLRELRRSARHTAGLLRMTNMVDEFVNGVRFAGQPRRTTDESA